MAAARNGVAAAAALLALASAFATAPSDAATRTGWAAVPTGKRALTGTSSDAMAALEAQVLAEMNTIRRSRGLRPLRISTRLAAAADSHSRAMARRGFFSHNSANGSSFSRRIERFYGPKGYRYWSVGENLLWSSPSVDAAAALRMWMNSPPHRANLLARHWREVGLAAVHVPTAPGVYGGREVTVVTADFGVRR